METLAHWINGSAVTEGDGARTADIVNPATGVVSGRVPQIGRAHV